MLSFVRILPDSCPLEQVLTPSLTGRVECSRTGLAGAFLAVFALGWVFFPGPAWSQPRGLEQPVSVNAEIGWDSVVKVGSRIPIRVWLDYPAGSEISGTVRIAGHGARYPGFPHGQIFHISELVLTPPARKRVDFTVPYFDSWRREVPIEFVSSSLREPIEVPRSPRILLEYDERLIVVAGRDGTAPSVLRVHCQGISQDRKDQVRTVAVGVETRDLSEHWADYDAIDLLVLQGFGDAQLPPRIAEAIAKWTVSGGRLLITGGLDPLLIEKTALWGLLPVTPSRNLSKGGFAEPQPAFTADSRIHRGFSFRDFDHRDGVRADTWPAFAEGPLVAQRRVGGGWIGYAPLVTESPPLAETGAGKRFWEQLLARAQATELRGVRLNFSTSDPGYYPGRRRRAPDAQRIPLGALALYLGCYFLFVGPINYLFLRRRKRFDLLWVTVPCLSVGFLFIAYAGGRLLWGTRMILRELALMEVFPRVNANAAESPIRYVSRLRVTSPSKSQYDVWLGDEIVPVAAYLPNNPDGVRQSGFEVVQGSGTLLRNLRTNMWSSRYIYTENVTEVSGGIHGTTVLDGGQMRGSIQCDLPVRFEKTGIYFQGIRQTDISPRRGGKLYSFGFPFPDSVGQPSYPSWHYGGVHGEEYTAERALYQAVYYLENSFQFHNRQQPYFVGVCSQPIQSIKVNGQAVKGDRYAVYLAEIPILAVERESEIPSFMWQEVPRDEGNIVHPSYNQCNIDPGQVSWDFYAPSFIDMVRPVRLEIKFSAPLVSPPNRLDILDPRSGQWRDLLSLGSVETGKVTIQFRDGPQQIDAFMDPVHRKICIRASIQSKMQVPKLSYTGYPEIAESHGLIQIILHGAGISSASSVETSAPEGRQSAD